MVLLVRGLEGRGHERPAQGDRGGHGEHAGREASPGERLGADQEEQGQAEGDREEEPEQHVVGPGADPRGAKQGGAVEDGRELC